MERIKSKRTYAAGVILVALVFSVLCAVGSIPVSTENDIRNEVVRIAESQLHVREATGNNDGPEITMYLGTTGLTGGYPWCAAFVSWVFMEAGIKAPRSARVVDWFNTNVVYKRDWRKTTAMPQKGMLVGLYYPNLGRYGHIAIISDDVPGMVPRSCPVISGNTNQAGSREGDGVYRKIYPWKMIAVMADYCVTGNN